MFSRYVYGGGFSKTKILVYNNDRQLQTNCFLLQFPYSSSSPREKKMEDKRGHNEELVYKLEMILPNHYRPPRNDQ